MKINTRSILSLSALFAAGLYAATAHAHADMPTPPQEAVQACSGKAENDACNFTGKHNEAITGTCHKGPDGKGVLACAPAGGKPDMGGKPAQ